MKVLTIILLLVTSMAFAVDFTNNDGDWESNAPWDKNIEPTSEDTLIISSGTTIEISSNYSYPVPVIIIIKGTLEFSGKLNLVAGSTVFVDGGSMVSTGGGNSDKLKIDGVQFWSGKDGDVTIDMSFPLGLSLPIVWGDKLYAEHIGNEIVVYFDVYSQINNDEFIIETSQDLYIWNESSYIPGEGNTSLYMLYERSFSTELTGLLYIRIKQVDYNRDFDYSIIFIINIESTYDYEILYYIDMLGDTYIEQPSGVSVAILRNNKMIKLFTP